MSAERRLPHLAAIGLALLVTFLWSTSWILIRWGLDDEDLDPLGFAAMRYGLAAGVLLMWVAARPADRRSFQRLERTDLKPIATLGLVLYALTQGAQFVAIDRQPAATTSLVLAATPLLVAIVSNRSLAEAPTPRQIGGAVLVVTGALFYFAGSLGATFVGMAAALVGLFANARGAVLGRQVNRSGAVPAVVITACSMTVGAAALGLTSVVVDGWPSLTGRAVLIVVWLAVVNTAVAFTWWNISLQELSALESAALNNTMLLQIGLLGWIFLDEQPGPAGFIGIGLVSVGVLLTQTIPVAAVRPARS